MNAKYVLQMYVAGITPDTQLMIVDIKDQLNEVLGENFKLKVVDVLEQPELAEDAKVLATPTMIRCEPAPIKRILLNESKLNRAVLELEITHKD